MPLMTLMLTHADTDIFTYFRHITLMLSHALAQLLIAAAPLSSFASCRHFRARLSLTFISCTQQISRFSLCHADYFRHGHFISRFSERLHAIFHCRLRHYFFDIDYAIDTRHYFAAAIFDITPYC